MANTHLGFTVWFTGLPCSGKSTISEGVSRKLRDRGYRVELLDGDEIRRSLCADLGFSRQDRDANVRRLGFIANLLSRNNVVAIVAAVSPYRAARQAVREQVGRFVEVHVSCTPETCEQRDVKGMYAKARAGLIAGFTGVDGPYEPPMNAEITVHTDIESVEESTRRVLLKLEGLEYVVAASSGAPHPSQ